MESLCVIFWWGGETIQKPYYESISQNIKVFQNKWLIIHTRINSFEDSLQYYVIRGSLSLSYMNRHTHCYLDSRRFGFEWLNLLKTNVKSVLQ